MKISTHHAARRAAGVALIIAALAVLGWLVVKVFSKSAESIPIVHINKPSEALGLNCYDWPRPNGEGVVTDLANCNVACWCTCVGGVVTEVDENPKEQDLDCALSVFQTGGSIPYHPEDAPLYCIVADSRLLYPHVTQDVVVHGEGGSCKVEVDSKGVHRVTGMRNPCYVSEEVCIELGCCPGVTSKVDQVENVCINN